ncbi:MAG: transposase [Methylocella sp.]
MDEEKLAIVLETEQPGVSVATVCRHHDIATSMVFRWRIQFGFCEKKRVKLAAAKLVDGQAGESSTRCAARSHPAARRYEGCRT